MHNQTLETNRRPASPCDAGRRFGRASHAPPCVSEGGRSDLRSAKLMNAIVRTLTFLACLFLVFQARTEKAKPFIFKPSNGKGPDMASSPPVRSSPEPIWIVRCSVSSAPARRAMSASHSLACSAVAATAAG